MARNPNDLFMKARTSAPLGANASFNSGPELCLGFSSICVATLTDKDCTLYVDFSMDSENWDSTITFEVSANINEVHRMTVSRQFFRVRLVNGTSAQSFLRLSTIGGDYYSLTSPLNQSVQQDSDALTVRSIDSEIAIADGLFTGISIVNKFGTNADVDSGTVPEDIWEGGGVYTGFPDSTLETVSVVSTNANDTSAGTGARTIRITGLDANYNVQAETISLNGLTPVASVNTFRRVHTATIQGVGSLGVNQGNISAYHTTTTGNVFLNMLAGRNQSNCSAYTVPAGFTAYLRAIHVAVGTNSSASIEGNIWTRSFGAPFRSRRPFFASNNFRLYDVIYGGLVFTEKSDLILRITSSTANNVSLNGGYDLVLVQN